MQRKGQIQSEAKEFLFDLLYLSSAFLTSACRVPREVDIDRRAYERMCRAYEKKAAWQNIQRLKEQKLLTIREHGDRIILALSDLGRIEALKLHIRCKKQELPAGEWCLVSFDVPEDVRRTRLYIRRFLKEVGFERLHHSLWRTRKDLVVPMGELIRRMKATSWMRVFRAREE